MMNKKTITDKTYTPFKRGAKWLMLMSLGLSLFAGCSGKPQATQVEESPRISDEELLSNQLMMSVLWYQRAAERKIICEQAYAQAEALLRQNVKRYKHKKNLTVLMDVDETVLDNSYYEARLIAEGTGFDPESWEGWVMSKGAPVIPGAIRFLNLCNDLGVEVFYVSNRSMEQVEATAENLMRYDLPFAEPGHMIFKVETSDKTERRENIKQGRTVILSVGDQMTDFISEELGEKYEDVPTVTRAVSDTMMQHFVLLPNPMYGAFEKDIYPEGKTLSPAEKMRARKRALRLD